MRELLGVADDVDRGDASTVDGQATTLSTTPSRGHHGPGAPLTRASVRRVPAPPGGDAGETDQRPGNAIGAVQGMAGGGGVAASV